MAIVAVRTRHRLSGSRSLLPFGSLFAHTPGNPLRSGLLAAALLFHPAARCQTPAPPTPPPETWNLRLQSTAIGDAHPGFDALYSGANSLPDYAEKRVSWTGTIFADVRLGRYFDLVVNPELASGRGFGFVSGIAGFPNGEIPRVAGATPTIYWARAYVRYVLPLSDQTEAVESDDNQLGGTRPLSRFTTVAGKFSLVDFFDNNSYSHDPRTQFMNWALMYNGAWDYPSDVRGYTVGVMEEWTGRRWSLRHATAMEPTAANGPTLDTRVAKNRGEVAEWESRFTPASHPGALRLLGFYNREHAGTFRESVATAAALGGAPNLDTSRRDGTGKYGFGVNLEQEIRKDIGAFARYGWADGKTEAWAFTQIDRSLSGGVLIGGRFWQRPKDRVGLAAVRNYLSGDQRAFLAAGGLGFIIGDGALRYAPETILETYYAVPVPYGFTLTGDYQFVNHPAYNQDRGPVSVFTLRIHWETAWKP